MFTTLKADKPYKARRLILTPCAAPVISGKFDASDADVIFESGDHVRFYIHRKNLETQAGAFPPVEFGTRGEIVPLTEDSSTLENLFGFMYPRRHPSVDLLSSEDFFRLAEAAEKYEVFALMNICSLHMQQIFAEHPVEVFNFGSKHGYPALSKLTVPFLLDMSLEEIVIKLSPHLVIPWVRYWKCRYHAAQKATFSIFGGSNGCDDCPACGHILSPGPSSFTIGADQPLSRKSLRKLMESYSLLAVHKCPGCGINLQMGEDDMEELEKALNEVPDFSTFF